MRNSKKKLDDLKSTQNRTKQGGTKQTKKNEILMTQIFNTAKLSI